MIDTFGRSITYLRVSVTDLCNLRCRYCMPEDGVCKKEHADMLTEDELIQAVEAAAALGITKLRITGGEPLVKKNIVSICRRASRVPGIREVCLTTNGILLPELARPLKEAGVSRLNLSLDTLDPQKYTYITRNGSLDDFTNAVAPDIIRDYGQPDVMFVKMCDLDSVRHKLGVDSDTAKLQLEKHDRELGVLMESIRRYGDFENTNFIVMGDHGQTDVAQVINFNRVFQDAGLQRLDENGKLEAFDAYCHSTGGSGWIELRDPNDEALRERVYRLLLDIRESGKYNIGYVFTKEEAREQFHLTGPFDFIIEGKEPMSFGYDPAAPLFTQTVPGGDYKTSPGTHGGLPWRDHRTTFFACGPAFEKGAVIDQARIVDEAPTMASIFGFEMEDIDGKCLDTLLKKA